LLAKNYADLASVSLELGDHAEAAKIALELPRLDPKDREPCRQACLDLSLCLNLAAKDSRLDERQRKTATAEYSRHMKEMLLEGIRRTPKDLAFHNFVAWNLATSPIAEVRDPAQAVQLARAAVDGTPKEGRYWNTLGVAHYRAGNLKAAVEALTQSMKLRGGGDGYDWLFLAMAHHRRGELREARQWFARAAAWMKENPDRHKNEELRRFQDEAKALLGK
jgi:tetratricopeptide (TPR) repeat protein